MTSFVLSFFASGNNFMYIKFFTPQNISSKKFLCLRISAAKNLNSNEPKDTSNPYTVYNLTSRL
jgi:hypothetical protein